MKLPLCRFFAASVALFCSVALAAAQDRTDWRINGLSIEVSVNGGDFEPFFAKGLAYSPAPVNSAGANGPPFNDYFYRHPDLPEDVAQYRAIWERDIGTPSSPGLIRQMGANSIRVYSMLRYGYVDYSQNPAAPIWTRAVDQLDWSHQAPPTEKWWIHHGHDAFLDMCWNNGVDPIYVWICIPFNDIFFGQPSAEKDNIYAFFKRTTQWLAEAYGDHPAVIGFILGNEHDGEVAPDTSLRGKGRIQTRYGPLDFTNPNAFPAMPEGGWPPEVVLGKNGKPLQRTDDPDVYQGIPVGGTTWRQTYWDKLNELHDTVKTHAPNKLTTTGLHDDGNIMIHWIGAIDAAANTTTILAETPREYSRLDIWSFNTYNIPGDPNNVFDRYQRQIVDYAVETRQAEIIRPLLLTELGVPASTRDGDGHAVELPDNAQAAADLILRMWNSVAGNRVDGQTGNFRVSSGAYIFEYTDEWWKKGEPYSEQLGSNASGPFFPGGHWDEEWFGLFSIVPSPDRGVRPDQPADLPLAARDVINQGTGDLNGGPDILTPRAAVGLLSQAFTEANPLRVGAKRLGGGGHFHDSPWIGEFYDLHYPWIYLFPDEGWRYVHGETSDSLFLWDSALGWTYTSAEFYPNLYIFSSGQWAYYDAETNAYWLHLTELD